MCGAPAPLLSAAVAIAKPTTGPPGVSAPATVANDKPGDAALRPEQRRDQLLRQHLGDEARADHADRDARQQREELAPRKAQRVGEHRLVAQEQREAERHHDRPQRDVDDEVHAALRCAVMNRQIARAARPARIGSGSEKRMRQVTKSSPKNGSSHTIARV